MRQMTMPGERYVGERRALRHFLTELRPLVTAALGENALLRFRIERALKVGDLDSLRAAREAFHNQPDDLKRRLMRGIFEGPAERPEPPATVRGSGLQAKPKTPFVRFEALPAARAEDVMLRVELEPQPNAGAPLRVMVRPGTLPSTAARALREIAKWIEQDRRLLSIRHWQDKMDAVDSRVGADLAVASEPDHPGDNADQA